MPRQCPFPVRSSDSRGFYRSGTVPGVALGLALAAALLGYAGFSHAAPSLNPIAAAAAAADTPSRA